MPAAWRPRRSIGVLNSFGALAEGDATPYIVDFDQVDADGDGQISEAEFKDGCAQDLVQEAAAAPEAMEPTEPAEPGAEATPESSQEY